MCRKRLAEIRHIVEECGYVVVDIQINKHLKVLISDGKATRIYVTGATPSDRRANHNLKAGIRRLFR